MKKVIAIAVTLMVVIAATGCESWNRFKKSTVSDWGGGLNRTVSIYDATGNLLKQYTGKFDIDYTSERIMFDDENNKRHVIYFKNGTVFVDEN